VSNACKTIWKNGQRTLCNHVLNNRKMNVNRDGCSVAVGGGDQLKGQTVWDRAQVPPGV
jgi:hypothetical protein